MFDSNRIPFGLPVPQNENGVAINQITNPQKSYIIKSRRKFMKNNYRHNGTKSQIHLNKTFLSNNISTYLLIGMVLALTQSISCETNHLPILKPGSIVTHVGGRVILYCQNGSGLSNYTGSQLVLWKKDGKMVALIKNNQSYIPNYKTFGPNLDIVAAKKEDNGLYECHITGIPPVKYSWNLIVQYSPQLYGDHETKVEIESGKPLTLFCNVTGNPVPKFTWKFNGQALFQSPFDKYIPPANGNFTTLHWDSVDANISGTYECSGENSLGKDNKAWDVVVKAPPRVEVKSYINGAPGKMMTLSCTIKSSAHVDVSWYKDGTLLDANPNTLIRNKNDETDPHVIHSSLIIENTKDSDFNSIYKCVGVNSFGLASVNLSVKGIPEIVEIHRVTEKINELDGSNDAVIEFSTVSHTPLVEIVLHLAEMNNGKFSRNIPIPFDPNLQDIYHVTFTLTRLRPNTEYHMSMQARNQYGWSEMPEKPTTLFTNALEFGDNHAMSASNIVSAGISNKLQRLNHNVSLLITILLSSLIVLYATLTSP